MGWNLSRPTATGSATQDLSYTAQNIEALRRSFCGTEFPDIPVEGQLWVKDIGSNNFQAYTYLNGAWSRCQGEVEPIHLADTDATADSMYYSTDSSKLVYKGSDLSVHDLY